MRCWKGFLKLKCRSIEAGLSGTEAGVAEAQPGAIPATAGGISLSLPTQCASAPVDALSY